MTIKNQLIELEKTLDDYDHKFLLHKIHINSEIEKILELREEQLKILPKELCFTYGFLLCEFGLAIQKEQNRNLSKKKWAEHNLNIVIGREGNNYGDKYTKYEIRRAMIIVDNEYAKLLNNVIIQSDLYIEELNFLSTRISMLGEILNNYGRSKRE